MAELVLGVQGFTEQPKKRRYVRGQGWKTVRSWQGPQALASAMEQEILDALDPDDINTTMGVPCTIEASVPDVGAINESPQIRAVQDLKWTLTWEDLDKDIRSHGKFNLSGSSASSMEVIDTEVRKGKGSLTAWSAASNMDKYASCRVKGIDTYMMHRPIVRAMIVTDSLSIITPKATPHADALTQRLQMAEALTKNKLKAGTGALERGAQPGNFVKWGQVRVGTNYASKNARFIQPTIHYCDANDGGAWVDKAIDLWYVRPPNVNYSKATKRYEISYDWLGMMKASKILYDLGDLDPDIYGEDP